MAACRRHGAPSSSAARGTSLAGQCCNVAVVIDGSRHLAGVLAIDPERRTARVRPGTVLDDLRREAGRHGLTFGPDPATHAWCTVGGMIGNNSCGVHSLTAGRTSDNVEELEILTYDGLRLRVGATPEPEIDRIVRAGGRRGEIYRRLRELRDRYAGLIRERFPRLPRRVSGYNLDELLPERGFHVARALAGSEGTCVTFLEATVRLVPAPKARVLARARLSGRRRAPPSASPRCWRPGPIGLEGMDRFLVDNEFTRRSYRETLSRLPAGRRLAAGRVRRRQPGGGGGPGARADGAPAGRPRSCSKTPASRRGSGRCARPRWRPPRAIRAWATAGRAGRTRRCRPTASPPTCAISWRCSTATATAPPSTAISARGASTPASTSTCATPAGIRTLPAFMEEAADLVVAHGGSLSGEHGDGQQRGELLPRMFGEELVAGLPRVQGDLGPGQPDEPRQEGRSLPARRRPPAGRCASRAPEPPSRIRTMPASFARAVSRCVGVGKCRRDDGRRHVPELAGDARGAALDARPRPAPLRDARGRA